MAISKALKILPIPPGTTNNYSILFSINPLYVFFNCKGNISYIDSLKAYNPIFESSPNYFIT